MQRQRLQGAGRLIGPILALIFIALTLYQIDFGQVGLALSQANPLFLLLAAGCTLSSYLLRTARWKVLLNPTRSLPFSHLFPVLIIGFATNNLMPARAGELVRAYVLGQQEKVSKSLALATVFLERVFDGTTLLFLLFLTSQLIVLPGWGRQIEVAGTIIFGLAALGLIALILFEETLVRVEEWVLQRLSRLPWPLPARLMALVIRLSGSFIEGLHALRHKRLLVLITLLSLSVWGVEGLSYYMVMSAFGLPLEGMTAVYAAFFILVIINFSILLPTAPGGIGVFEFFGTQALMTFGISRETAFSSVLVSHTIQYILVTGLGALFMARLGVSPTVRE